MIGDLLQTLQVVEFDMPMCTADDIVILKARKHAAHGFLRDSQMVAYIAPGHAQIEFGG